VMRVMRTARRWTVLTDDRRLEQALHDAAPTVDTAGVVERVAHRRTRRRRNQRLALGAGVLAALLVFGSATLALTRDDGGSPPRIAAPSADFRARVVTAAGRVTGDRGKIVIPQRVRLDRDVGLLRAPMLVGSTSLSVASDNPDGGSASHLVRVDGSHVVDVVDFKARVLALAEGEGARWALTRNLQPTGAAVPDTFLKRVTGPGEPESVQLLPGTDPSGRLVAAGGGVWVPTHDGSILYFTPDGKFRTLMGFNPGQEQVVGAFSKGAANIGGDGKTLLLLTPGGDETPLLTASDRIVDFDGRSGLLLLDRDRQLVLGRGDANVAASTPELPAGFVASGFSSSPTRTAVTGTVDGDPALVLLHDDGRITTVVLEHAAKDAALAWTDAQTVVAVAGGALYEIRLP
jgi:hypothetical protein